MQVGDLVRLKGLSDGTYGKVRAGEYKKKWKSMPYAICKVLMSDDSRVPADSNFLIAGYRLKKKFLQGNMVLVMDNEYIADYEKEYGNEWVSKMIEQENEREAQRQAKAAEYREKNKKNI